MSENLYRPDQKTYTQQGKDNYDHIEWEREEEQEEAYWKRCYE